MNKIEIYIDDKLIDYVDNSKFPIAFTKSVIDYKNLEKRKGEFSFTVTIPFTKNNRLVFENIDILNRENKFNRLVDYSAKVLVNGITAIEGIFKLQSINEVGYVGMFLGSTISWFSALQGLTLRDLDLDEYDFNNLESEITSTWDKNDLTSDILYPLLTYGNHYNPGVGGGYDFNNLVSSNKYTFRRLPPAVYLTKIIKAIFRKAGIEINGDFLEDEDIRKLYVPKLGKDESFWNWRKMGASVGQRDNFVLRMNGDPNVSGQVKSFDTDVHNYWTVLFDYYVKSVHTELNEFPINPQTGELFLIRFSSGLWKVYRYNSGSTTDFNSYTLIADLNTFTQWHIYAYNQGSNTNTPSPATWTITTQSSVAPKLLPLTEAYIRDNVTVKNRRNGYVNCAMNTVGQYNVVVDKGRNFNEAPTNVYAEFAVNGNKIFSGTNVTINGITFTMIPTNTGAFTNSVYVEDSVRDLYNQIRNSSIGSDYPGEIFYRFDSIVWIYPSTRPDLQITWSAPNMNDFNFYKEELKNGPFKYTVPIDSICDLSSLNFGTISNTHSDIGIEGYAFYPQGNNINNRHFGCFVKNLGVQNGGISQTQLCKNVYDFIMGTNSLDSNILAYVDITNGLYTTQANYNTAVTNGGDIELTEGDEIIFVHLGFIVGQTIGTGNRNIGTELFGTVQSTFEPGNRQTNVIKNYDSGEWVPAYTLINPARCLPLVQCQDFIRGIMNMFNLYLNYDATNNTINIVSYDKFYKEVEFSTDITNLVDDNKITLEPIKTSKLISFKYNEDKKDTIILDYKYDIVSDNIYSEGENKIIFPFTATWNGNLKLNGTDKTINCPVMFNAGLDSKPQNQYFEIGNYDFGMRLLSYKEKKLTNDGFNIVLKSQTTDGTQVDVPVSEFPSFLGIERMVDRYYGGIFNLIENKDRLILDVYLNELDYSNLRLDIGVKYKDNYYYIESIEKWSPLFNRSKCTIKLNKR